MMLLVTHLAAIGGGLWAKKVKFPAGMLVGAMLAVVALNLITGSPATYPRDLRTVVQFCSGAIIGLRFSRKDIRELRMVLAPVLILVVGLIGFNMIFGFLIHMLTPSISTATALLSCAPGGLSDLAILAPDFGADPQVVTLLQLFRFVFVLSVFPALIKKVYLPREQAALLEAAHPSTKEPGDESESDPKPAPMTLGRLAAETALSLAVAACGGLLFRWLGIPAGAIIGAISAVVLVNMLIRPLTIPKSMRMVVQICCGCFVGTQVTREAMASIGTLLIPMLLIVIELFCMAFITSWVINKLTGLNQVTALFSCVPGGITEMGLLAEDLGLDLPKITLAHTCRIIAVISLMPALVNLFAR